MIAPPVKEINPSIRNPRLHKFGIRNKLNSTSLKDSTIKIINPIEINMIPRKNNQFEIPFTTSFFLLSAKFTMYYTNLLKTKL